MTTNVPNSKTALNTLFQAFETTQNEADWTRAAVIHAWTTTDTMQIDRAAFATFTAAPGFRQNHAKVRAYREAYEVAISEGIVNPLKPGDKIVIPTANFANYIEATQWKIKARTKKPSKAKSQQQENLERDGHKTSPVNNPSPRVSTPKQNIERAIQEVEVALKKVTATGIQRQQIEFARLQLESALTTFTKAVA